LASSKKIFFKKLSYSFFAKLKLSCWSTEVVKMHTPISMGAKPFLIPIRRHRPAQPFRKGSDQPTRSILLVESWVENTFPVGRDLEGKR
jgi:hypothetical protein